MAQKARFLESVVLGRLRLNKSHQCIYSTQEPFARSVLLPCWAYERAHHSRHLNPRTIAVPNAMWRHETGAYITKTRKKRVINSEHRCASSNAVPCRQLLGPEVTSYFVGWSFRLCFWRGKGMAQFPIATKNTARQELTCARVSIAKIVWVLSTYRSWLLTRVWLEKQEIWLAVYSRSNLIGVKYILLSLTHPPVHNILDAPTKRYFFNKKNNSTNSEKNHAHRTVGKKSMPS